MAAGQDVLPTTLDDPTAKTIKAARINARAIEKGSNDKARRADQREVIVGIVDEFLVKKK